ncbi:MAG TPA: hypothetical protein VF676_10435 [Flavobacterium sp.]|jgi:hypothetical protein
MAGTVTQKNVTVFQTTRNVSTTAVIVLVVVLLLSVAFHTARR